MEILGYSLNSQNSDNFTNLNAHSFAPDLLDSQSSNHSECDFQSQGFLEFCQSLPSMPCGKRTVHFHHKRHGHSVHSHRHSKIITDPRKPRQGGLIFEWPQRPIKSIHKSNKFVNRTMWATAHTLYWLHRTNILPSGIAVEVDPPLSFEKTTLKPPHRVHCNIIEPDW